MDLRLVVCYGFIRLIIKFYQFLTNNYGMDKRRVIVVAVYLYNMLHEGLVQCECIVSVSLLLHMYPWVSVCDTYFTRWIMQISMDQSVGSQSGLLSWDQEPMLHSREQVTTL